MASLLSIGRTIISRLRRAERRGTPNPMLYLPKTDTERRQWADILGVSEDRIGSKLIAVAAEARHRDKLYRESRLPAPPRKTPRNRPGVLGLRTRKRRLKKRGTW